eukprot:13553227-Ditylum_brightwellii.AAC.1
MYRKQENGSYHIYDQVLNRGMLFCHTDMTCSTPPDSVIFSQAAMLGRLLHRLPQQPIPTNSTPPNNTTYNTYDEFAASLSDHVKQILGKFQDQQIDPMLWINELNRGSIQIASDGSVRKGKGPYAVILKSGNETLELQGH